MKGLYPEMRRSFIIKSPWYRCLLLVLLTVHFPLICVSCFRSCWLSLVVMRTVKTDYKHVQMPRRKHSHAIYRVFLGCKI